MLTSNACLRRWGIPYDGAPWLTIWTVPAPLRVGPVPNRVYCNRAMVEPLRVALTNLIERGHIDELKTWDGCFNIRQIRGGITWSLHSWGIAVDVNAADNPLGAEPVLSSGFVQSWTDAGFDWGGTWSRRDGMHFQLRKI